MHAISLSLSPKHPPIQIRQKDFLTRGDDDDAEDQEYDEGFEFEPDSNDRRLRWRHHFTRRMKPSTDSPLKKILSREISNLERYFPLLARRMGENTHKLGRITKSETRHRYTTPIFSPAPTVTTKLGRRRELVTTTPTTESTTYIRKEETVKAFF